MKLLVYIGVKRKKGILLEYPSIKLLFDKIEKKYKIKLYGNNLDKAEFIKKKIKNLVITINNFDKANYYFLLYLDMLKPSIKELIINLDKLDIPKSKLTFLIKNNAVIVTKEGTYFIKKEINLEPITISIFLLILLYLSSYLFSVSLVILLFYLVLKRILIGKS